jgi:hypothetical protein
MEGGQPFIEPWSGVQIFQKPVESPLRVLGIGEGCVSRPLNRIVDIFWQGLSKTS